MKLKDIFVILTVAFVASACNDALDKKDLSAITEQDVWNNDEYATAYLNTLYRDNLPGWDESVSAHSDEADGSSSILYGQLTTNSIDYWPYTNIRNINILLQKVDEGSLSEATRISLKAQAKVLRAWRYFQMVRYYGGVPMIMQPQELGEDLYVSRNKTSESVSLIIRDLDDAISDLPWTWTGNDLGRFTKATAMAIKGRMLLYYASPQFNPNNDASRWETAYNFLKQSVQQMEANGYGLYSDYQNLWFDEMNCEVIFVKRYQEPDVTHHWDAGTRPLSEAQNYRDFNQPTLEMVNSYPMADGTPIKESEDYDQEHYWRNRDPRFAGSIAFNGCTWELSGKSGRLQWNYDGAYAQGGTSTGFYCRKAINESYTPYYTERSSTDWIEIRYAEVLLNFAECAAETGHLNEAYDVLKRIRERAGITAGSNGLYGLKTGMGHDEMIDAIMLERKIELAFEGKRYWDLRRRRLFASELNGTRRHGLKPVLKITQKEFDNIKDRFVLEADYSTYFRDSVVLLDEKYDISFPDNYYFYAIPHSHIERNSNLEQTQGWDGGKFNPYD